MSITVREATPDEAPLVHRLMLDSFAEYRGVLYPSSSAHDETADDVRRAMNLGGAILALDDQQAVGSTRFQWHEDHLYANRVAVLPSHRGRGIASLMMRYLEDLTRQEGRSFVRVACRASLPGNVRLYRSLGYAIIRIEPHDRGTDEIVTLEKGTTQLLS